MRGRKKVADLFFCFPRRSDYPLSSVITSEFAATRIRGRMMTATFWSQGWGQLAAALVALASLAAFKKQIINDPAGYAHHLDFVWRLVIGLGAVPGACALYFRLTLPETPRFTMDVERNIKQASSDVDAFLQTGGYVTDQTPAVAVPIAAPKATWRDFGRHFRKYENFKLLFGTAFTWFALDVAFYGLGLNSSIILSAIGYGSPSSGTPSEKRYYSLHNNAVGNIIITVAGLIPGFWASFALIDFWGRRVSVSAVNLLVAGGGELIQTFRPLFRPFLDSRFKLWALRCSQSPSRQWDSVTGASKNMPWAHSCSCTASVSRCSCFSFCPVLVPAPPSSPIVTLPSRALQLVPYMPKSLWPRGTRGVAPPR